MRAPRRRQMPLTAPRSAHARAAELADVGRLLLDRIVARTVPLIQAAIAKR